MIYNSRKHSTASADPIAELARLSLRTLRRMHAWTRARLSPRTTRTFCTPDQLQSEVIGILELMDFLLKTSLRLPLLPRHTHRSTSTGSDEEWPSPRTRSAARSRRRDCLRGGRGRRAFYAPKIDVKLRDRWPRVQCPTIQVDLNLPNASACITPGRGRPTSHHADPRLYGSLERSSASTSSTPGRVPGLGGARAGAVIPVNRQRRSMPTARWRL